MRVGLTTTKIWWDRPVFHASSHWVSTCVHDLPTILHVDHLTSSASGQQILAYYICVLLSLQETIHLRLPVSHVFVGSDDLIASPK